LVSANLEASHIRAKGGAIIKKLHPAWVVIISFKLKLPTRIKKEIKISAKLTSYEMVCATLRRPPSMEYLELEDHPLRRTV
jgi:hypothetical protein